MIVWLKPDSQARTDSVAVNADILRADDYVQVLQLNSALAQAEQRAMQIISAAEIAASDIERDAVERAAQIDAAAQARFESSGRLGYAAGQKRGLEEIHAQAQHHAFSERETAQRSQTRLANVVLKAVEQIVLQTDRDALFARIGNTLQRLVDTECYVQVQVHPADAERARRMLAEAAASADWAGGYDVIENPAAQLGDCRCEWDYGVLDGSLDAQLSAIRRALSGSVAPVEDVLDIAPEADAPSEEIWTD